MALGGVPGNRILNKRWVGCADCRLVGPAALQAGTYQISAPNYGQAAIHLYTIGQVLDASRLEHESRGRYLFVPRLPLLIALVE
ncbi:unnamed protein product [Mycena citricolor]|uniref:Uncharacterized protein n=1 Tax=Mycena citricolor TaxID=2018698 RepID=A0AAD2K5S2_9AGAR|nr:unnamed protein product [Mycena citricolor]